MVTTMHDTKIATKNAGKEKWIDGCLVISESDAQTIWIYDVDQVKCPRLQLAAAVANEAIERMTEAVKSR